MSLLLLFQPENASNYSPLIESLSFSLSVPIALGVTLVANSPISLNLVAPRALSFAVNVYAALSFSLSVPIPIDVGLTIPGPLNQTVSVSTLDFTLSG